MSVYRYKKSVNIKEVETRRITLSKSNLMVIEVLINIS